MPSRCIAVVAALCIVAWTARQTAPASAGEYEESVARAEQLWAKGEKAEAVSLYGTVWRLNRDDVDRQILYGERSAEVGNYRWAFNFFRVAEPKVKDDPARLSRVYEGYANVYRLTGDSSGARPYQEKAAQLRKSLEKAKATPPPVLPKPYYFGYYTEASPGGPSTSTLSKAGVLRLKKRIAVAPVHAAGGREDLANYAGQIRAMLIAELRKTDTFIVVGWENGEDLAARTGGAHPTTDRPQGAQLLVKAEIAAFREQPVAVALALQLCDPATSVVIASETVAADRASSGQDLAANALAFRWDDPKSQAGALGSATRELVQKALEKIVAGSAAVPWRARVTKAAENEVHIDADWQENLRIGDRFKVVSAGRLRTHPAGQTPGARTEEESIGEIEIVRVEEKSSVGRVVKRTGAINPLDWVIAP